MLGVLRRRRRSRRRTGVPRLPKVQRVVGRDPNGTPVSQIDVTFSLLLSPFEIYVSSLTTHLHGSSKVSFF